jgi:hypothetical protein
MNHGEDYVAFEGDRGNGLKTAVYRAPQAFTLVKAVVGGMLGKDPATLDTDMDYRTDLRFGDDDLNYIWQKCNDLLELDELNGRISINEIRNWTTVHDTIDSMVKAMAPKYRRLIPNAIKRRK